jgi:hypothetical protein
LIEHEVATLERIFGIALNYEDLNDHDQLRYDPSWPCWPASWRLSACGPRAVFGMGGFG